MSLKTYFSQVFKLLFCVKVFNYALFCGVNVIRDTPMCKKTIYVESKKNPSNCLTTRIKNKTSTKIKTKIYSMDIEIINNFMVDYIESKLTHIGVKIKIKGHIMPKLEGPKFDGIYSISIFYSFDTKWFFLFWCSTLFCFLFYVYSLDVNRVQIIWVQLGWVGVIKAITMIYSSTLLLRNSHKIARDPKERQKDWKTEGQRDRKIKLIVQE